MPVRRVEKVVEAGVVSVALRVKMAFPEVQESPAQMELMARMASVDCLAKWARTARRELPEPQGHLVFLGRTANRASQAQLELMVNQESQGMLADQVLARSARLASRAKEVSMARLVCL